MAYSFSGAQPSGFGALASGSPSADAKEGPEVKEIETEQLGFQSLAGETKIRLLPSPWPSDQLPPPTSSLLSIASKKGLLAAGGPESVVIASTELIRQAYLSEDKRDGNTRSFNPQITINVGTRISQVAFTADEKYLVISAEIGGGLAVYEMDALSQGNTKSTFEIATDGQALRALLPTPAEAAAELVAVLNTNGSLLMANLSARQMAAGIQGPVLNDGVSSLSWSNKGKQLVIGLVDGTCSQMTPVGEVKAQIPRPPMLEGGRHGKGWLLIRQNERLIVAQQCPQSVGSRMTCF